MGQEVIPRANGDRGQLCGFGPMRQEEIPGANGDRGQVIGILVWSNETEEIPGAVAKW